MINAMYQTVLTVLNENQMGKVAPVEFNHILGEAVQKNYAELFGEFRKLNYKKSRFQDTSNYGNEAYITKQAQEYYIAEKQVVVEGGDVLLPNDYHLVNSIFDETAEYEKTDLLVFNKLKRIGRMQPTSCAPIFTYHDGSIRIFPYKDKVELTYYRKAKMPKWTYRIIGGAETFDPDKPDFQDIDMHPLMLHQLFVDVLSLCGLNIQHEMALQYSTQMKQEIMTAQQ